MEGWNPPWLIYFSLGLIAIFSGLVFFLSDNWKNGFLIFVSGAFGYFLKVSGFGFTCTFRNMFQNYEFSKYRGMIIMLLTATLLIQGLKSIKGIHPLFDWSRDVFYYATSPIGWSLVIGSFVFGAGMILGSGCASGTLVGIGEGFFKSYIVLPCFIFGATLASSDLFYDWWGKLPKTDSITLPLYGIVLILLALIGLTYIEYYFRPLPSNESFAEGLEDIRRIISIDSNSNDDPRKASKKARISEYVFSAFIGVLVALFFICTGETIGVMGTFAQIGARVSQIFGAHPELWKFFLLRGGLEKSLLYDTIFISDVAMILGAFLASTLRKDFARVQKKGKIEWLRAILGGLFMGIGARMASGCNIGSMLSGITSKSLHGFVWMMCAAAGCASIVFMDKFIDSHGRRVNTYTPVG